MLSCEHCCSKSANDGCRHKNDNHDLVCLRLTYSPNSWPAHGFYFAISRRRISLSAPDPTRLDLFDIGLAYRPFDARFVFDAIGGYVINIGRHDPDGPSCLGRSRIALTRRRFGPACISFIGCSRLL